MKKIHIIAQAQYSLDFPDGSVMKNPSEMREMWVRPLGWEDALEGGMTTHPSIPAWRVHMDRGAWWATDHGVAKSWTQLSD